MKICLINNLYKPYSKGGAEKVLELIKKGLELSGHEVFVITTEPRFAIKKKSESGCYRLKSIYFNLGSVPIFFRLFWHFYDMFDIFSAIKTNKILKKEKPDLVITNNLKGISYLIPWLLKISRINNIHILHDVQLLYPSGLLMNDEEYKMDSFFAQIYTRLCCFLFSFSGTIVSPSQWLMEQHIKKGFFEKAVRRIIPNPTDFYNKIELDISTKSKSKIRFLYVGQLEEYKGVRMLVEVFRNVYDAELEIVGDGNFMSELKVLAEGKTNIIIHGKKSKDDVLKIMSMADCLIVPSLCYENSPTVIYEAMTVGLPVIASRIGGVTEFLHKIGGVLFVPADKDDLRKKINWIINNPAQMKNIKDGYKKRVGDYCLDKYIEKLLKDFL